MVNNSRPLAPDTPDWQVIGVMAEGDGLPEFSYTVGLHERGLPEIFFWASPSDGTDPGDDWQFRHLERGRMINRWAYQLIDGRLHPGDTWTEAMDFGLATVTFTCGELVEQSDLEAYLAHPACRLMPISYALLRDAPRAGREVDAVARAEFERWTTDVLEALAAKGQQAPTGLPSPPYDFSHEQEFGPGTALVGALRSAVSTAHPRELGHLLLLSLAMQSERLTTAEVAVAGTHAFARAVGRQEAQLAADVAAMADAHALSHRPEVRRELARLMRARPDTGRGRMAVEVLTHRLGNALGAAYTAAGVLDVLPRDLLRAAMGPVLTSLTSGSVRGLWFGSAAREHARAVLGDLAIERLAAIAVRMRDLSDESSVVHVHSLVGDGEAPPAAVLLAGTATLASVHLHAASSPVAEDLLYRRLAELARALALPDLPAARTFCRLLQQ